VTVIADDVLLEETVGAVVRRSREADQKRIEVIEHLLPEIVDRPVAFIDDDEVEELDRDLVAVDDRHGLLRPGELLAGCVPPRPRQEARPEDRIEALDRADADLAVGRDVGGFEAAGRYRVR